MIALGWTAALMSLPRMVLGGFMSDGSHDTYAMVLLSTEPIFVACIAVMFACMLTN